MNNNRYCIIMAGGSGTRFWPLSRESKPKQFLDFDGTGNTFIKRTYARFSKIVPKENIFVVTLSKYKDMLMEQLPEIKEENILLEPYSRNTSPCIAYATYSLMKKNPNAIMVATPADHLIPDEDMFYTTMMEAMEYVEENDVLMTIGITPDRPDTNYGYIQVAGGRVDNGSCKPSKVKTFTEKPDAELAKVFLKTGEFFWNSGIYIWKTNTIKEEMETHIPEITTLFKGWEMEIGGPGERTFLEKAYTDCEKISIDYGVMEKTERAWLYPAKFSWTDMGTWETLYRVAPEKDARGNVFECKEILEEDNYGTIAVSNNKNKLIAIKGLKDYIVVDTDDVLMICPKEDKSFKEFTSGLAMPGFDKFR